MTPILSVYSFDRAQPRDLYTYRGEPVEVVTVDRRRKSITVRPLDNETFDLTLSAEDQIKVRTKRRKFRVTRDELIQRAGRFLNAKRSVKRELTGVKETYQFIFRRKTA